jgi:hypothetical protein
VVGKAERDGVYVVMGCCGAAVPAVFLSLGFGVAWSLFMHFESVRLTWNTFSTRWT